MKHPDAFIHDRALVEPGATVGARTRVWAFAHVLPGAVIGSECIICDQTFIENDVKIGDRVTIKCGVQIWDGVRLEDDVFVGPNATFTNDLFPRSKQYPASFEKTVVRRGASIGANATILAGRVIGRHAMVGAGAVVTRDVPPYAIVVGNPAAVIGYVRGSSNGERTTADTAAEGGRLGGLGAPAARAAGDGGGRDPELSESVLPFHVKSLQVLRRNAPGYALRSADRVLVCASGAASIWTDDGRTQAECEIDRPGQRLAVPRLVWAQIRLRAPDSVVLELGSEVEVRDDRIGDYEQFVASVRAGERSTTKRGLIE
jgi:acetyltransferase-like isoleucine patch superfamily enzyme